MRYTIAQVSKRTGIGVHTLRYYDKEGLLPFVERTSSGIRSFKESDFGWLKTITCMKKTDMPIKRIKEYIDLAMKGDETLEARLEIIVNQKKALEEKIEEMNSFMETIENKIVYLKTALEAGTEDIHRKKTNP